MLKRYDPKIIAVTGSVGKTSMKEALYAAFQCREHARCTRANFNNELGVPLTILSDCEEIQKPVWWFWIRVCAYALYRIVIRVPSKYPTTLVLEYGADRPGDITYLTSIARPDIAVISAVGDIPVHIEFYTGGVTSLVKEKAKLVQALPARGIAIINADDPHEGVLRAMAKGTVYTYGQKDTADMVITHIHHLITRNKIQGITFKVRYEGSEVPVIIQGVFSIAHAYAIAGAALAACKATDCHLIEILNSIVKEYRPVTGRSLILEGIKHTQIIDESYNSSPLALQTALQTMQLVAGARRVAVLGDMLELGTYTMQAHEQAGTLAAQSVDVLITVGTRAKLIAEKAIAYGMYVSAVHSFDTVKEAGLKLQEIMKAGDVVLIKGSHSIGLEKVVEEVRQP